MNILSIGGFTGFGTSNTCLLRNQFLETLGEVDAIDTTSKSPTLYYRIINKLFKYGAPLHLPDLAKINQQIVKAVSGSKEYDLIWIDKGIIINTATFKIIRERQSKAKIVGYSPDWMGGRHNQSQQFIESMPFYDCYATTKSYSVPELYSLGAKDVIFVGNAYQKGFHRPYVLTEEERREYDSTVSFIGSWEKDRSDMIEYLAANGVKLNVWGGGPWAEVAQRQPNITFKSGDLMDERYCKVLSATKISLCFLRKVNKDLQTTRSIEIPACGSMMLAERTGEHQNLFEENKEAVFFSTKEELLEKCKYYIAHEDERAAIAAAGYRRCLNDDYSYGGRIMEILNHVFGK